MWLCMRIAAACERLEVALERQQGLFNTWTVQHVDCIVFAQANGADALVVLPAFFP